MNEYWSGDGILNRGMRAVGNTVYDVADALSCPRVRKPPGDFFDAVFFNNLGIAHPSSGPYRGFLSFAAARCSSFLGTSRASDDLVPARCGHTTCATVVSASG